MRKSKEEQRKKDRTQIAAQTGFVGFSRSLRWLPGVAGGFATAPRFPLAGAQRLVLGWDGTRAKPRPSGTYDWRMTEKRAGPNGVAEF